MGCKWCCFPFQKNNSCSHKNRALELIKIYSSRTKRKIVLLLVGLDDAGKSTIAKRLNRQPIDGAAPTVGFKPINIKQKYKGYSIALYDLGGGSQIRGIWPKYYVDVHGIIFVVDASDVVRIDQSRKILEQLLSHEKLAGKPVLILGNKQDKEGALDKIDLIEKLNVEVLVNQQKCFTIVEPCSAINVSGARKNRIDPDLLNGFEWLLRHVVDDYAQLSERVEHDSEEQKVAYEVARQEWLQSRQDTETQADSLTTDFDGDPFKSIDTLVTNKQNGHVLKSTIGNGHAIALGSLTSSQSRTQDSSVSGGDGDCDITYIPLHSPHHSQSAEPNILVVSEPLSLSVVNAVKVQIEYKAKKQKKKKLLGRNNRTAPASASRDSEDGEGKLPPLRNPLWARPPTAKSLPTQGWGLGLALEEVEPPDRSPCNSRDTVTIEVMQSPRTLASSSDDDNDVIISSSQTN